VSRANRSPHLAAHEDDALAFLRLRIGGVAQWTGLFSIANAATSLLFDAHPNGLRGFAFLLAEGREPCRKNAPARRLGVPTCRLVLS
jgi:hypothetical protein